MGKPSKEILDFMSLHKIDSDEIWEVHGSSWCIKHKALERASTAAGIVFMPPEMIETDSANGIVALRVEGVLNDRCEWSIGEASPKNNKNAYPYAMAEKRGKDRVILKLLNTHGYLYSEAEADEFAEPEIIKRVDGIETFTVDAQRPVFGELTRELAACETVEQTKRWKVTARSRASRLSENWRKILEGNYLTHLRSIEQRDAIDYVERATNGV